MFACMFVCFHLQTNEIIEFYHVYIVCWERQCLYYNAYICMSSLLQDFAGFDISRLVIDEQGLRLLTMCGPFMFTSS